MKSKLEWLWLVAIIAVVGIIAIACDNNPNTTHTHNWGEWSNYAAATCQTAGEESRSCGDCDKTEIRETAVNPSAHHWQYEASATIPTCITPGSGNRHCTVDGCTETSIGGTYPADPSLHVWQYDAGATIPTCVTAGSGSRHCTVEGCSATGTSGASYPALGHDFGNWTVASNVIGRTCERDDCTEYHTLLAYLQSGTLHAGTAANPVPLTISIDLGNMGTGSNWRHAETGLLAVLGAGGKLVALDLSGSVQSAAGSFETGSTMSNTAPGPVGLRQIVSLDMPAATITSIPC